MENIELKVAIMAGVVLSLFLIVGEIAALRKRIPGIRKRLYGHYRAGRLIRFCFELCGIAAFFLIQPLFIGLLVVIALGDFNPAFSVHALQQLQQRLHAKAK